MWDDFKTQFGKTEEFAVYAKKLNEFLDGFQRVYREFVASQTDESQRATIDKIYGDCTEVTPHTALPPLRSAPFDDR